jgi:hypothetical protein
MNYDDQDIGYEEKVIPKWVGATCAVLTIIIWAGMACTGWVLFLRTIAENAGR